MEDKSPSNWSPYQPVAKSDKTDATESEAPGKAMTGASGQSSGLSRKTTTIIAVATGINCFIFGVWLGYRCIPQAAVVTSLKPTIANLFPLSFPLPLGSTHSPANLIADVVAKANPAVVTIDVKFRRQMAAAGNVNIIPPAEASGLIVRSDGYILTNSHVVHKDSDIKITLDDKRVFPAKLVGRDDYSDLAVLKIEAQNLPVLKFADAATVRPGDWAIAIGAPLGFDHTVTMGVVSSVDRSLADFKNRVDLIQHDAALNLGNSGGPLINLNGEVIGINTAVRDKAQGIGFATPADVASDVATKLIADGVIPRPFLGVYMEDIDPDRTRSLTLPSHPVAVRVTRLASDGPAEKAGLAEGDLIVKINNHEVRSAREVRMLTRNARPGDVLDLQLQRGSRSLQVQLTVGDLTNQIPEG
jgi:S1-C subfamily serine protease